MVPARQFEVNECKSITTALEAGFLLRAGTRVIYPAMTLHVPGYRPDGRSFFSVTCVRLDSQ